MKKNFTTIKLWSLVALFSVIIVNESKATIIYHDEVPDVTQTQTTDGGQLFQIDMNGDLTTDFTLSIFKGDSVVGGIPVTGTFIAITCENGSAVAQSESAPVSLAAAYNSGNPIESALSWQTDASVLSYNGTAFSAPVSGGNFTGSTDQYIGVRFTTGANTYYGWIRVTVTSSSDSYTIKDWAYEDTPDATINAGSTITTNINSQLADAITLVNNNNVFELSFPQHLSGTIKTLNMAGSVVASINFSGKSCQINLAGKTSGIYHLIFETISGEFAKKVYIE